MIVTDIDKLRVISINTDPDECKLKYVFYHLISELHKHENGVGLAAVQIGIPLRACSILMNNRFVNIINPTLKDGKDKIKSEEACLSLPGVIVETERYNEITATWIDYYTGETREHRLKGMHAIAMQHEVSHMQGILITDEKWKEEPKTSRNSKCPCGSGKKFKKCCGK